MVWQLHFWEPSEALAGIITINQLNVWSYEKRNNYFDLQICKSKET